MLLQISGIGLWIDIPSEEQSEFGLKVQKKKINDQIVDNWDLPADSPLSNSQKKSKLN